VFAEEPGLQFAGAQHIANHQIVGARVAQFGGKLVCSLAPARVQGDDRQMARAVGIPVSNLFTIVFCLGAGIAGDGTNGYVFLGTAYWYSGSALALTSFGKNPDKAMKLLEFLTGRQSMSRHCRNINMLPSRVDVPVVIGADKTTQKVFQDAISKYGRSFPVHPLWGSIEQIILNGVAHTLWDFSQSGYKQNSLFKNLSDINQEIEYMLSLFGE